MIFGQNNGIYIGLNQQIEYKTLSKLVLLLLLKLIDYKHRKEKEYDLDYIILSYGSHYCRRFVIYNRTK